MRIRETSSGNEGTFCLEGVEPGTYLVEASKQARALVPGRVNAEGRLTLHPREAKSGVDLILYSGHTIRGTVRRRPGDAGVAGVLVTAEDDRGTVVASATTGTDGGFALSGVKGRRIELRARQIGLAQIAKRLRPVVIALDSDTSDVLRDLEVTPAGKVSGTVLTPDGRPVAWATVRPIYADSVDGLVRPVVTDTAGTFTLEVTPGTAVRVVAEATRRGSGLSRLLETQHNAGGVVVVVRTDSAVAGRVVDPAGRPVGDATVTVEEAIGLGITDHLAKIRDMRTKESGVFRVGGLPPREIWVTAHAAGFAPSSPLRVDLVAGQTKVVLLSLREPHTVSGTVTAAGNMPVVGAHVVVVPEGADAVSEAETYTDLEGRYAATGLPASPSDVTISHPDFGRVRFYGIAPDAPAADFVLGEEASYSYRGKVIDWRTGQPVKDLTVTGNVPDSAPTIDPSDPGAFSLEKVPSKGLYKIWLSAPDHPPLLVWLRPSGQASQEGTFVVGPGATLAGRVIRESDGGPLTGVEVIVMDEAETEGLSSERLPAPSATTGPKGEFHLAGVTGSSAVLLFRPAGEPVQARRRVAELGHGAEADVGAVIVRGR